MKQKYLIQFIFLLITFFSVSISYSQNYQPLTNDPDAFIDELEKFLKNIEQKKEAKELTEEMSAVFSQNFSLDQKKQAIDLSNTLLGLRIRPNPDYINLIESYIYFGKSKQFNEKNFDAWINISTKLIKLRNPKKFNEFIEFSKDLFKKGYIYNSKSVQWKITEGDYEFFYDKVPYVKCKSVNLKALAKNDSSKLLETDGVFNVASSQWIGEKGVVTWERVKAPAVELFAELGSYKINMKSAGFSADSVKLTHPYFDQPILGKLREKVVTFRGVKNASYPAFSSYNQKLIINEIFPNIDYEGGFRLQGYEIQGGGEGAYRGTVTVKNKGKALMIAEAKNIQISPDGISAPSSRSNLFIYGGEIISHPSATFNFIKETDEYSLVRESNTSIKSPFESTYHQLDMHFEEIKWIRGEEQITLGAIKGSIDRIAVFESRDYFSIDNYNQFSNGKSNILYALYRLYRNNKENKEVSLEEFCKTINATYAQAEPLVILMNNMGIISYDKEDKMMYIKDRLEKYIKARSQTGDYDNIKIESDVKQGANATINLVNNDLIIKGVVKFPMAVRKNVKIFPKDATVLVKNNRNMNFDGVINAGRAEIFASNMDFVYEDFKINLPLTDSVRFRVYPINDRIKQKQVRLLSRIENLQGTLYIDEPTNRSGNDTLLLHYPKLEVTNETYVYYDNGMAFGRNYDRNDFKFKLKPFTKDSLFFFTTENLTFDGTFYSAGIFPDMKQTLSVQYDYSLGFKLDNVTSKIYEGRADYENELALNSKGLQGKGGLSYLTSSAESNDIVFFKDSLIAEAQVYNNKGQKTNPNVPILRGKDVFIVYQPKRGIWTTETKDSLIEIFEDDITKIAGKIELTQAGMVGEGTLLFNKIEVLSSTFKFKNRTIDAAVCEFIVKGQDPLDPLSFQAINMNMHIDFDTRIGDFESNDGDSYLEFPDNQFICYMDKFQWFMDSDEMGMANDEDSTGFNISSEMEILEPNFFSTRPDQDSLSFASNSARYDMKKKKLTCENIEYIPIADAKIYPDSGILVIKKRAKYEPLENAVIVANAVTRYHTWDKASVQLYSKKKYKGSGIYTASSDSSINSKINFTKIEPNEEQITLAEGEVDESANFNISSEFKYYGKAFVNASEMGVTYQGKTSIIHDCQDLASGWIDFEAKVDTSDVFIPLGKDFDDFVSGIVFSSTDSLAGGFYTSFMTKKLAKDDEAITEANGWLAFDREKREFIIGPKDKIKERLNPGNLVGLNIDNCNVYADGIINFAHKAGQFDLKPYGKLMYDTSKTVDLSIKASIVFDFPFTEDALKIMGENLQSIEEDEPFDLSTSSYDLIIKNKLEQKKADKAISDLNLYGKLEKFPKELTNSFTILDMDVIWDQEKRAFMAKGEYGIANVGETQVFKKVKVYLMVEKTKNGDIVNLNIQAPDGSFYYFNYKRGIMQTAAFDGSYNDIVADVKPKKATFKGKKGEEDFQFMGCSKAKRMLFMENFIVEDGEVDPFGGNLEEENKEKEDTEEKKEEKEKEEDDW